MKQKTEKLLGEKSQLRQNETDDLIVELDSLSSLRAIRKDSIKYEDLNWNGVQNEDLLKNILIKLRMRPAQTEFRWVRAMTKKTTGTTELTP